METIARMFKKKEAAASSLLGNGRDVGVLLGAPQPVTGADKATQARSAYNTGDVARSKDLHDGNFQSAQELHGGGTICGRDLGDNVKSIVFGGLDGIM